MQNKKIYTIKGTKLDMAYCEGFVRRKDTLCADSESGRHVVILNRFCSYESGTKWGRFHCKSELSPRSILKIYALASDGHVDHAEKLNSYFHDSSVTWSEKREYFVRNGSCYVSHEDVLLYSLSGEYLWIAVEIEGDGKDLLYDMRLDSQGDNFMWTFPEIYQEEESFFHRYMSIFSSVYQDMADQIAHMDRFLDIETTPVPILMEIANWFGFEAEGDFLGEDMLRRLMKEIYHLNRIKGTKEVIKRLIYVLLGEEAAIIERNRFEGYIQVESKETYLRLFGKTMQDVTIFVWRQEDEKLQSQVMYLLKQFKPVRSHIHLVFSEKCSTLDSYCFLDRNAALSQKESAYTDDNSRMNGQFVLG